MNPARCRVLAVGKVRRGWIQDGIDLYLKRLPGLTISELRDSNPDKEADAIRAALRPDETLIALCLLYTSPSPRDLSTSRMPSSA